MVGIAALALIAPQVAGARRQSDFNGDGRPDLAIGVPYEGLPPVLGGSNSDEGAVNLLYSGRHGPKGKGSQFLHRGLPGIAGGGPDTGAAFGTALAAGDFNGDRRQDLAVGVPGENGGTFTGPGAVNVLYGGRQRLSLKGDRFLTQDTPGMAGDGGDGGDLFGYALAAGDFNDDGRDDLAIGAPFETLGAGPATRQGAVTVVYGSRHGLRTKGSRFLTQDSQGMAGDGAEDLDRFGLLLTAADFNGDRCDDLAIGVPRESVAASGDGAVNVVYGSRHRLRTSGSRFLTQQSPGIGGDGGQDGEDFGASLAAADFDRNRHADLAVGTQFESLPSASDAGAVTVLPGSRRGLQTTHSLRFTQDSPGMAGDGVEVDNAFGARLVAGDFNGDHRPDLAVGARGETVAGFPGSGQGAVNVIYSSRHGLRTMGSQFIDQGKLGIPGESPEQDDEFGDELAAADFNRDGSADLAIGVPNEAVPGAANPRAGAVDLLPGGHHGLRLSLSRELDQSSPGISDTPEANDFFGMSLEPPNGNALINVFD